MVAACCDDQLFECVIEAADQSDDLTGRRHEQHSLIELIFHDGETLDVLEHIDVEFFNETISPLQKVDDWI